MTTEATELAPRLVIRTFSAEIAADGDGRTIEGLVIPFNVEQTVADPPAFEPYTEVIAPGAFRHQIAAPGRQRHVLLDFEHYGALTHDALGSMGSMAGTLGHATELEERPDGLYGRFRVLHTPDGDKALELAHAGVLSGFSAAMKPKTSARIRGGVRRLAAHLDRVSLCRVGAYPEARVLAIRTEAGDEHVFEDGDLEQPLNPAIADMLLRGGVTSPHLVPTQALRAFTTQPWDGSASRWPDADSYCSSCLVDNNPDGQPKTKDQCHFPVREPGSGDVNIHALEAVVGGRGTQATFAGAGEGVAKARRLLEQFQAEGGN